MGGTTAHARPKHLGGVFFCGMKDFEISIIDNQRKVIIQKPGMTGRDFIRSQAGGAILKPFSFSMVAEKHDNLAAWRQGYNNSVREGDIANSGRIPISSYRQEMAPGRN